MDAGDADDTADTAVAFREEAATVAEVAAAASDEAAR